MQIVKYDFKQYKSGLNITSGICFCREFHYIFYLDNFKQLSYLVIKTTKKWRKPIKFVKTTYEIKFATITLSFNKNNFCQNFVD